MARIRTIKPDFFRHEGLFELERVSGLPVRIAFAGLWTAADREGRFAWAPKALKLDCLPYDEVDFARVLDTLINGGFIVRYEVAGKFYGCIPSWKEHQHVNQREAESKIPEPSPTDVDDARARTCMHVTARGEGKGREGKGTVKTADAVSPNYQFEGSVIKLSPEHYRKWQKSFGNIDLEAELRSRDDWLSTRDDPNERQNWFISTSNHLTNRNAKAKQSREGPRVDPRL